MKKRKSRIYPIIRFIIALSLISFHIFHNIGIVGDLMPGYVYWIVSSVLLLTALAVLIGHLGWFSFPRTGSHRFFLPVLSIFSAFISTVPLVFEQENNFLFTHSAFKIVVAIILFLALMLFDWFSHILYRTNINVKLNKNKQNGEERKSTKLKVVR